MRGLHSLTIADSRGDPTDEAVDLDTARPSGCDGWRYVYHAVPSAPYLNATPNSRGAPSLYSRLGSAETGEAIPTQKSEYTLTG